MSDSPLSQFLERQRLRFVVLRTAALGIRALSADAKAEASALVTICDEALADIAAASAEVAQEYDDLTLAAERSAGAADVSVH